MKCYVTGRSSNIAEVERTIEMLRAAGHEITFDWPSFPMVKPYEHNVDKATEFASAAILGIIDADVYILLAHTDGTGVFTELGAALAISMLHGKLRIYGVAREIPPVLFHYHPAIVWKETIEEVLAELN